MSIRIGLVGLDSSHAEDFLRHFNAEARHPAMRVTAMWGGEDSRVSELLGVAPNLVAAPSLDALIGMVDAVIVGDRHGDIHREHALPAIAAGKPVFIDKPLANRPADAEAIVAAAEKAGTPLLSGSALRWQAESKRLKAKVAGIDGPFELMAYGTCYPDSEYGGAIFYAIHTIELVQELIGVEWRKLKLKHATEPRVQYRSGDVTVTLQFRPLGESGSSAFGVEVSAPDIKLVQQVPLGDDYMAPVADQIATMITNGASPMTHAELLAPVRLMDEIDALLKADA